MGVSFTVFTQFGGFVGFFDAGLAQVGGFVGFLAGLTQDGLVGGCFANLAHDGNSLCFSAMFSGSRNQMGLFVLVPVEARVPAMVILSFDVTLKLIYN